MRVLHVIAGILSATVVGQAAQAQEMVFVPGGEFEMGDSFDEGFSRELPVHTVYLSPYYIDTYEVTNQQYADGLNWAWGQGDLITVTSGVVYKYGSGTSYASCDTTTSSSYSRIIWNGSTFGVTAGKETHPMVEVNWCGAVAYCNWRSAMEGKPLCYDLSTWACNFGVAGYRLPTEAEWEKAAGWDPVQQRHFRFGEHTDGCGYDCLDGQRANYAGSGDPFEAGDYPWTTPKGFYSGALHYKVDFGWPENETSYQTQDAQSYYGCYDMSGNVWEWCYDWHSGTYYSSSPGSNPTGPASGTYRVLRGGGWNGFPSNCRSACRYRSSPGNRYSYHGLRCASGTATCTALDARSLREVAGVADELSLDIGTSGGVEPRTGQVAKLEIDLDDAGSVSVSDTATVNCSASWSGTATVTAVVGNTVTVEFSPSLPNEAYCVVALDCNAEVCVRMCEGDMNRDGDTNTTDASAVKLRFGQTPTDANCEWDFNCDGAINTTDASQVTLRFGFTAPECP